MVVAALVLGALALPGAARAADPRHPDWPCRQIKVPSLSVVAFWNGPSIEKIGDAWIQDPAIHDLVPRLAARRTPTEEAEKAAGDFVTGTPEDKQRKAALLFAGLFATLNHERDQVMDGIERYARRQHELRDRIQTQITELHRAEDDHQDAAAIEKLSEQVAWDTRVFDDRRRSIGYVCDVPATIERRLFALARAIQQSLE
ncbi:MAG: hypothetical protein JO000_25635 [Alphaproteobacteria bacterium]|nr:hypothetical protein [Alphaproteobacteria bacterium]